ncbi:putative adenylyltransferase/sulfurtransferase MoeZ [Sporomusa ovata DSM 2662]|uniref:Rhodanese-like domain protein n=1 Tax=Sporomusa ovata TaxID=2378 RepID=A0A0U1L3G6_9FIRM|nr:rhodanese-like domain-containing protein [Sporomusa ovata]EQB25648.1 rhodanese-like sulfurtransferase [Sporomusa ovata DSM 2662]CQR74206.1 Rhodanese-like domain protein [Sporomusa ovata]
MNKIMMIVMLVVVVAISAGCNQVVTSQGGISMTTEEALSLWQAQKAVIIDVRTLKEYQEGHIPDAVLIPLNQLETRLDEIPKDQTVLLICRSGRRSAQGTNLLRSKGFEQVVNIEGGMLAWRGPVVK